MGVLQVLKVSPQVTMEYSWSPHTKALIFSFHKTPSSPSSFIIGAKSDQITPRETAVAFRLISDGSSVFDIASVIKSEMVPSCNGYLIDTKVRTSVIGNIDIISEACKPFFIKLSTKRPESNKIYITKLGVQLPYTAEVSISEAERFNFNKRPFFMTGAELVSPYGLKTKFAYEREELREIKVCTLLLYSDYTVFITGN